MIVFVSVSGLMTAIAWPASLLGVASVIDNPWSVCLQRATQVSIAYLNCEQKYI